MSFLSGAEDRATAMAREVKALIPDRRHYAVGLSFLPKLMELPVLRSILHHIYGSIVN